VSGLILSRGDFFKGLRWLSCGARPSEKASVCQGVVAADAQEEPPGRSPIGGADIIANPDAGRNSAFLARFAATVDAAPANLN
jgi:hypothetical protein